MKKGVLILIVAVVFLLGLAGWFIRGLNYVVILDENVNQSWAQVENQLQRRNDLIPNLVNTVKGYAGHERGVFTEVTQLRSQWASAATRGEKITAAREMGGVLSRLLLVAENYPDLKANQNFLTLQSQLEGTENRIAVERRRYNQAVMGFNAYRRTVFGSLFARMRGLIKPAEYFEAEEEAARVPEVKF
ncbi:MAG: LemA family protein [Candidatus Omnitrophica bacterium]|nr:LemA family protein [Candidatus Omnitrophota bacterium]MBU3933911.1 LemA family protein [Candidatus Omnitrophota bacterium]MBU4140356.1 LemA family protein [Candidatus Omnitrophota bacterium]